MEPVFTSDVLAILGTIVASTATAIVTIVTFQLLTVRRLDADRRAIEQRWDADRRDSEQRWAADRRDADQRWAADRRASDERLENAISALHQATARVGSVGHAPPPGN